MTDRWRRTLGNLGPWTTGLALALTALLAVWPLWFGVGGLLGAFPFGGVDFKAYYLAGLRVQEGLPLYGTGPVGAVPEPASKRFLYPPVVALPFAALPLLPPLAARVAFLAVQFCVLWGGVLAVLRAWGVALTRLETLAVGWLLAGVQPVVFLLRIGNVTGFVAGLLCFSAAVTLGPERDERPFLGGALATLAALPKPYVAPAGAHLLGDRRRLVGAGLAAVGLVVTGLAFFGPGTTRTYLDVLTAGNAWSVPNPPAPVPWHFRPFAWLVQFDGARALVQGAILCVAALTALVATDEERPMVFAMGCVTVPLVAPSADTLTLLLALPGLLVAGLHEWHRQRDAPTGDRETTGAESGTGLRTDGALAAVLLGAVGVQTSVYALRTIRHYGPEHLPALPWGLARDLTVVQPATVGLLVVFGLCLLRVWTPHVRPFPSPEPSAR